MFKTDALDSVANAYVDEVGVTPGTRIEADDRNIIQDEITNAVEGAGLTLDAFGVFTNNDQLLLAMKALGPTNKNAIINGIGEINQRVTAYTLAKDVYSWDVNDLTGPDRHEGMATGTAVTAGTFGVVTNSAVGVTGKAFKFAGVTLTGTGVLFQRYRMEAADAVKFKNQTASFSSRVLHDVGSAKDFTVFIRKADVADNFSAVTAIANSGAQSIETATNSDLNFLNISMGDCSNGIEIEIQMEVGAITTKNVELTELQFEHGVINSDFEYSEQGDQLAKCQRRCDKSYDQDIVPGATTSDGIRFWEMTSLANSDHDANLDTRFTVTMADTPAVIAYDTAGASGKVTMQAGSVNATISQQSHNSFNVKGTNGAGNTIRRLQFHYFAAIEL